MLTPKFVGGIVIKEVCLPTYSRESAKLTLDQAIVTMANEAMKKTIYPNPQAEGRYIFPVKGCIFFGVPHKGAEIADKASGFLSALGLVFNVNKNKIRDLKPKSQRLANISSEFRSIQSQHRIPVVSFYETEEYNKALGLVSLFPILYQEMPIEPPCLSRNSQVFLSESHCSVDCYILGVVFHC